MEIYRQVSHPWRMGFRKIYKVHVRSIKPVRSRSSMLFPRNRFRQMNNYSMLHMSGKNSVRMYISESARAKLKSDNYRPLIGKHMQLVFNCRRSNERHMAFGLNNESVTMLSC